MFLDIISKSSEVLVGSSKLLLVLASTVVLGYDSHWIHGHILLSHDPGRSVTLRLTDHPLKGQIRVHETSPPDSSVSSLVQSTRSP
jgi:hypothetical protein